MLWCLYFRGGSWLWLRWFIFLTVHVVEHGHGSVGPHLVICGIRQTFFGVNCNMLWKCECGFLDLGVGGFKIMVLANEIHEGLTGCLRMYWIHFRNLFNAWLLQNH